MKDDLDVVPLEQAAEELDSTVDELKLCIDHGILLDCGKEGRVMIHRSDVETLKELRQLHIAPSTQVDLY